VFSDVTDGELKVLNVLWDEGAVTIRRLTDAIYPSGTAGQYATVQKLLERLEMKGHVTRDRSGRAHRFSATIGRDALIGRGLQELAAGLCGGSVMSLFTELVKEKDLSASQTEVLRQLVDDLDRQGAREK